VCRICAHIMYISIYVHIYTYYSSTCATWLVSELWRIVTRPPLYTCSHVNLRMHTYCIYIYVYMYDSSTCATWLVSELCRFVTRPPLYICTHVNLRIIVLPYMCTHIINVYTYICMAYLHVQHDSSPSFAALSRGRTYIYVRTWTTESLSFRICAHILYIYIFMYVWLIYMCNTTRLQALQSSETILVAHVDQWYVYKYIFI